MEKYEWKICGNKQKIINKYNEIIEFSQKRAYSI